MLSVALAFCMELAVLGAEPAPTFDEAAAKSSYATFAYQWHAAIHGPERTKQRWRRTKVAPDAAPVAKWPIGARGIYGNSFKARGTLRWVVAGLDKAPEPLPEPLGELFEQWEYCHESELEARACVPGAGSSSAFRGAGACYFVPRCEYGNGGYWLALRDAANGPELVGVLIWKEDRPAPTKDPQVGKWLAGIEKGLAQPPK